MDVRLLRFGEGEDLHPWIEDPRRADAGNGAVIVNDVQGVGDDDGKLPR